ncbi:hypothetical protein QQ020_34065 [Fulvivirgaceae bacterium BMA12]|uniref:Peroxidase n=1 Tax=Agaribacillus aureus TaxID=3051825 RepID=A0ABT8LHY9_9BACT|nr:hypothetical protein [Fulvivirgaceae bacterium BMA12]
MKLAPNPYNLIVAIKAGKMQALKTVLANIQADLENNSIFPFERIKSIHFARFVILPQPKGGVQYPDYLAFATNYDGDLDSHLLEIIRCPEAAIDQIFDCCEGYIHDNEQAQLQWFKENARLKAYYYRGTWGRKATRITYEESSRKVAEDHIDSLAGKDPSAKVLRQSIVQNAKATGFFNTYDDFQLPKPDWWLLPLAIPILLVVAIVCVIPLLILEMSDDKRQHSQKSSGSDQTKRFTEMEDRIVQNQLTHLVEIKPGWFRLMMLKLVLNGIAYLAKVIFNGGRLGGIPTIHYARWIIIDKGRRLLFFSNFDGSWERYLGDFVDKAALGLTAVWSNTKGFPKTRLLMLKGAKDEQRFKSWARAKQVYTNVWYSAYRDLTVTNIANNGQLQKGLTGELNKEEIENWLLGY